MQIGFGKTEPAVGVEFARFFELVGEKIEDRDATAFLEDAVGRADGALRIGGVMERLAEEREVDTRGGDRWFFDFAKPVLEVFEAVFFCQAGAEFDHLLRIIDGDDLLRAPGEKLGQRAFAGPEICDNDPRHEGEKHVGDTVPGAARAISATKLSRELIEVFPSAVVPFLQRHLERGLVASGFGQFLGRDLHDRAKLGVVPFVDESVVDVLSGAAIADEAGLAKLCQVAGNSGLPHAEDFLDLDDGELFLLKEKEETQPGFVGEKAQGFYD